MNFVLGWTNFVLCPLTSGGANGESEDKEKKGEEEVKMEEGGEEEKEGQSSEDTKEKPEESMEVDVTPVEPTPSDNPTSHDPSHDPSHEPTVVSCEPEPEKEWVQQLRLVQTILAGKVTVALHQEFLIRNNHTDLQILKNTKVHCETPCGKGHGIDWFCMY